jgi:hypothetical protein
MISREDLESFLIRTELDIEEIGDGLWLVEADGGGAAGGEPAIAVSWSPPLVILRADVGKIPDTDEQRLALYRKLLELNSSDMVHGAYGVEGENVILTDALEIQDLDYSEFLASLESLSMALSSHREHMLTDR